MQILRGIELLKEIQVDYNCFSDNSYDIKEWYGNEYATIKIELYYLVDNELSIHGESSKKEILENEIQESC